MAIMAAGIPGLLEAVAMIPDHRRHLRLPAPALECTTNQYHALALNLSEAGLRLQLRVPVHAHERIKIRCNLAAFNSFFEATGEVVWRDVSSGQAGVRLLAVPELSRMRLVEWLFQHALAMRAGTESLTDAVLHLAASRAQLVTRADGAAIALADGEIMLCRASSGAAAPQPGVRLESDSGLAMECLRTGDVVVCADSEADLRADLANCRALGIRSAIVLPLQQGRRIGGLLGVFSERAYAFDSFDLDTVKRMAVSIVAARSIEPAAVRRAAASCPCIAG